MPNTLAHELCADYLRHTVRGLPPLPPCSKRELAHKLLHKRETALFHEQQEEDEAAKVSVVAFGVTTDTC